jgi:hypothetical protein
MPTFSLPGGKGLVKPILFLFLVLLLTGSLLAQTTSLQGVVRDPQNRLVPGAEVTLTSQATGATRTALTGDQGIYVFAQIAPGTYELRAELPGFKSIVASDLRLLVDTPATLDLRFELGEVAETIVVSAERMLNRVDASIGVPFDEIQIAALPLESRNVFQLLSLQPGVTQTGYVAGGRSDQSNLTLDGIDVNEQQLGTAFESVLRVTPDSVQEFRVTTTNPTASQGRSSGAQVSLITKSGTNFWHGSLYHYHRNTVTTANNFFNNRAVDGDGKGDPVPRPALLRNLFGGSVGGPIARDKAFFFFNYEGRTDRSQQSVVREVPLPHLGQGQVKYKNTAGDIITLEPSDIQALYPVGINPVALSLLSSAAQRYPANDNTVGDGLNTAGYRFNAPMPLDWHTYIVRVDYLLSDSSQLFFRGNYQWDNEAAGTQRFPDTPRRNLWTHPAGMALGHTWSLSSTFQNTARYGLTRQAFSSQGDSAENSTNFRFVYQPYAYARTLSRVTPVHNFTDDVSWFKNNHNIQFGTNIRIIRNHRESLAGTFDHMVVNPYYYANSGSALTAPIPDLGSGSVLALMSGVAAVVGRYAQYGTSFNFGLDGSILAPGTPNRRTFATEEYELYFQDTWRMHPTLTLTAGLRWGMSIPVYETQGYQVKPTKSLGTFFEARKGSATRGIPRNDIIEIDLAGPVYGRDGWYEKRWKDFSPRAALAWSPSFDDGPLGAIFGSRGQSVLRGGFGTSYDRIGSALAVFFDLNNALGYSSSWTVPANTYNLSDRPAPLYTAIGQDVRVMPGVQVPERLVFPLAHPADGNRRIESTLDDSLTSPLNYNWSFSWARELPGGFFVEGSYFGRKARNLLAQRDIMAPNNITDILSGMDYYTAARILSEHRLKETMVGDVPAIPFWENMFPNFNLWGLGPTNSAYVLIARDEQDGLDIYDWTWVQHYLNNRGTVPNMFFHPQWGALETWSTVGASDYHAFAFSARRRLHHDLSFDMNYTFSKSIDDASGLQRAGVWDGSAFIINSLRPEDMRAVSDFDLTHMVNSNWLWSMPFGSGRRFANTSNSILDAIIGGWNLNGIYRWNSGLPTGRTVDMTGWQTNWQIRSANVRIRDIQSSPTKKGEAPNLFEDVTYAYQSFRTPFAGESGDRNIWRLQGYSAIDIGLFKSFKMPYEGHSLTFRWETFNVTNTQRLGGTIAALTMGADPNLSDPGPDFGKITNIQGEPRVMQFGLRYQF